MAAWLVASILGVAGPMAAPTARAAHPRDPGTQMWVARHNGTLDYDDYGISAAARPDGRVVYVTGWSAEEGSGFDYGTLAYSAGTGHLLWRALYNGPENGDDWANSMALSMDGRLLYVTGSSEESPGLSPTDYATVAYDSATGAQLWAKRYNGPGDSSDGATGVAVTPDGTRVLVTGASWGGETNDDYATVAYDAATGGELWVARFTTPNWFSDGAQGVWVSSDGTRVFVTGRSYTPRTYDDFLTIAYDAASGAELWTARYDGPAHQTDTSVSLAVNPNGGTVFVTGTSHGEDNTYQDYGTVAYDADTGAELWVARYDAANQIDLPNAIQVSPDGATVYVTGGSADSPDAFDFDYLTVAYHSATGGELWEARYQGRGEYGNDAFAIAVSPNGSRVYVTGTSNGEVLYDDDYATLGYDAASGAQLWVNRYAGPGEGVDAAVSVAVNPRRPLVFVTGYSLGMANQDYATVAYRG